MLYQSEEIQELRENIRRMVSDFFGDRVREIYVETRDCHAEIGVGIQAPGGWRHAVTGNTADAFADPEQWTRTACSRLAAWLDEKAAQQPQGPAP